jgi:hypothetical protein
MMAEPTTPSDEGESQTNYLPPAEGGSYRRNPDGSLTCIEPPTAPPEQPQPQE